MNWLLEEIDWHFRKFAWYRRRQGGTWYFHRPLVCEVGSYWVRDVPAYRHEIYEVENYKDTP